MKCDLYEYRDGSFRLLLIPESDEDVTFIEEKLEPKGLSEPVEERRGQGHVIVNIVRP